METLEKIALSNDPSDLKALFAFDSTNSHEEVLVKFDIWGRKFHTKYFSSEDADFHHSIDLLNLMAYRGEIASFTNIAFREAAKTARTKLFLAFCISNDLEHFRRYIKVLAEDSNNSKQIVTDIYNMLIMPEIIAVYPEIFAKTTYKREERMESFTTATGIKLYADTVGDDQRGAIQEEARPDLIWFEDFENRTTLRSNRKTKVIWENMEEARTGLAKHGACIYTCNYISEQGNVHKLVGKKTARNRVLITPIEDTEGNPTWPARFTKGDIDQMREDDDDFDGERLCKPSASKDVLFDREMLEKQEKRSPIRTIAGFKIFHEYNPSHRYGSGHDVSGGVGLDSSTSVFIDFEPIPAKVVATFKSNTIKPDVFGDEIAREGEYFNKPICAPERNNHGHATIGRLKQLEVNLFSPPVQKETKVMEATQTKTAKEYGWHTNALTKPKMIFAAAKAIADGQIECSDADLIEEAKAYTRNDLIDNESDPRETTRHFDLLIAFCIAWQMKDFAEYGISKEESAPEEEEKLLYPEIGM